MKRLLFSFLFFAMAVGGHAQDTLQIDSKEEAIAILRSNKFFEILRNPTDTLENIDRFINEIGQITPIDQQKIDLLKPQFYLASQDPRNRQGGILFWSWSADFS